MDRKKELEIIREYWRTPRPAHYADTVHDVLILLEELDRLEAIEAAARKVDDEEDCLRDDCNIFGRDSIMTAASRKRRNEALTSLYFVLERYKRKESRCEEVKLWGLWHNGWCCIDSWFPETRYAGTLEQVEAQKKIFEAERAKNPDHPGFRANYDIVPFDKDREPEPTAKRVRSATEAQKSILRHIQSHGNFPTPMTSTTPFSPGTRKLIEDRAWVMDDLSEDGRVDFRRPLKLTKRGLAELQDDRGKKA